MKPLEEALLRYADKSMARFHVPSHKGRADILNVLKRAVELDVTELPDTGSLFDGQGPTAEAEKLATELFGTAGTFFSAGGCTLCIQAMIRLAVRPGGKIIMSRTVHRSAVNALALLDIEPVWVLPRRDAGVGLPGRVHADDIELALRQNSDAEAVYVTSPDYYGVMCDVQAISGVCRRYGVPLLVDNAHGAHLWYASERLHPLQCGATMSACSAHKTLPVLTGGAFLNISDKKYVPYARNAMALFGSTSPSFLTLLSLDICRQWLEDEGLDAFSKLRCKVESVRECATKKGIALPAGLTDPMRITLGTYSIGLSGADAAAHLRDNGIEPEYSDSMFTVLIPSPFNTEREFEQLADAICSMPEAEPLGSPSGFEPTLPTAVMTPSEAMRRSSKRVAVSDSIGRISAKTECPCPPGVPVVMPGELITRQAADVLASCGAEYLEVID